MTGAAGVSPGTGRFYEGAVPAAIESEWDDLAERCGSPFLSMAWLRPWTDAFARTRARWLILRDHNGRLAATGCFVGMAGGGLAAAANIETSHWDVAAVDAESRQEMWRRVSALAGGRMRLATLPDGPSLDVVRRVLGADGFRVLVRPDPANPRLTLPATWEELLARVSPNLRAQYRRRQRTLAGAGAVRLRVTTGGPRLEQDLETFFRLEASGWKGRCGTAVLMNRASGDLYRGFAQRAASSGWLRLALLEVSGRPVAGDLSCAFAGGTFMLKTAYDERLARNSPGFVLRGEALRAAIEEGSRFYDFIGAAEPYKLRWGGRVQPYSAVDAYRGRYLPAAVYHQRLRPVLKAVRRRVGPRQAADNKRTHC